MSEIEEVYSKQAKEYDLIIAKLVPDYQVFLTLEAQSLGTPMTLLDIGCGTGNTVLGDR